MKRNIISVLAGIAILGGFSASAFAATNSATDCNGVTDLDIKTSAHVICKYISTDSAYGVASAHTNGSREYGTASTLGVIKYTSHTAGTSSVATPDVSGTFTSSWTSVGD